MIIGGIFGPKLSGKTTLAKRISAEYWRTKRMRSIVLDLNGEQWHNGAWVTANEIQFWDAVWKLQNCLVVVEEAAATIRRDRDFIPAFTRIRHQQHRLIVVGHSGIDLLPTMRQQIDEIYLFRQPEKAAEIWADTFADTRLLTAMTLKQYEFLHCRLYGEPKRCILGN